MDAYTIGERYVITQRVCDDCIKLTEKDKLREWAGFGAWLCPECWTRWERRYTEYVREVRNEAQ